MKISKALRLLVSRTSARTMSVPGFVTGCWTLDRATSESVVMITFDSIEAAEALANNVRANAPHQTAVGIELMSIRIVEVSASA